MSCWTPRELDLAGYILTASREAKRLDGVGDHDQADEIRRRMVGDSQ
jgi:hypothetical protein